MKKILKNKKGFTLIELLAVIVVLSIIMVIATQQVNSTIKKSRGNSFYETVQSIRKSMQTVCATDNGITATTLAKATSASDISIHIEKYETPSGDYYGDLIVAANAGGKFTNVIYPEISKTYTTVSKNDDGVFVDASETIKAGDTVTEPSMRFKVECPINIKEDENNGWNFDDANEIKVPTTSKPSQEKKEEKQEG